MDASRPSIVLSPFTSPSIIVDTGAVVVGFAVVVVTF
jgi:hypothetical protein